MSFIDLSDGPELPIRKDREVRKEVVRESSRAIPLLAPRRTATLMVRVDKMELVSVRRRESLSLVYLDFAQIRWLRQLSSNDHPPEGRMLTCV